MVIQAKSNNVALLFKLENNIILEEANASINAYDSRKPPN